MSVIEPWNVAVKHTLEKEADSILIHPIGDVHYGAMSHMSDTWQKFVDKIIKEKSYLIILGDMINNNLISSVGSPYDDVCSPRWQKENMSQMLRPIADRILFVANGNHENRSKKTADSQPLYDICCRLGIEDRYRDDGGILWLKFGESQHSNLNPVYSFLCFHGSGGGTLTGGGVNRFENFAYNFDGIDGAVGGHIHKAFQTAPAKIVLNRQNGTIKKQPFFVCSCASWLDYVGYPVQKLMRPSTNADMLTKTIRLYTREKKVELTDVIQF